VIHNADGGEVEQCGNGARCFARYVADKGLAQGDRLKVQLTCDPGPSVWADVIVYQDDGAAFPIAPAAIPCGNHATVPGAFRISGRGHALVCVALGVAAPPARAAHGPAPGQACVALAPE